MSGDSAGFSLHDIDILFRFPGIIGLSRVRIMIQFVCFISLFFKVINNEVREHILLEAS